MLGTTRQALAAILATDPSVTKEQREACLIALASSAVAANTIARIIRRDEAAKLLGVGVKRVDQLARAGVLVRVTVTGCKRAIGFSEASLRAITEGEVSNA